MHDVVDNKGNSKHVTECLLNAQSMPALSSCHATQSPTFFYKKCTLSRGIIKTQKVKLKMHTASTGYKNSSLKLSGKSMPG